ncbi:hypothetical protein C2G38_2030718 [Gigaspora rosea]|uniref:MD-2-related lipid-recognition domain-containing protein n=1 Tax=Gigaspora rosea TaxID=44941 RepID=A0A397VTD9_9GLOM|nr:hypothetical protein C2G38_2030718 [Gigaspora rosea]
MKNFIFAFILFAFLLTANAAPFKLNKRTTSFSPCPFEGVDPLTVSMTPDPPESGTDEIFDVTGILTKHGIIKDKTILGIAYADLDRNPIGDPYSATFNESYKAGDAFSVSASVPTAHLPGSYYIGVIVGDPTNDPEKPLDIYACAFAHVTGGSKFFI